MNGNQGYQQPWFQNQSAQTNQMPPVGNMNNLPFQGVPLNSGASSGTHGMPPPPGGFPQHGQSPRPAMPAAISPSRNTFSPSQTPAASGAFIQQNSAQSRPPKQFISQTNPAATSPQNNLYRNSQDSFVNGPMQKQQPQQQQQPFNGSMQLPPKFVSNGPTVNGNVSGPQKPTMSPVHAMQPQSSPQRYQPGPPGSTPFVNGPSAAPPVSSNQFAPPPVSTIPPVYQQQQQQLQQQQQQQQIQQQPIHHQPAGSVSDRVPQGPPQATPTLNQPTGPPPIVPHSNLSANPMGAPAQPRRPMYPPAAAQQSNYQHFQPPVQNNGAGLQNGQGEYPLQQHQQQFQQQQLVPPMAGLSVREGMNKLWGVEPVNLLQEREVLDAEIPVSDFAARNCLPEVMKCTMSKIPETSSLLQKSRLPLGIILQPFKDLKNLPVIQTSTIVRCRACRTYINPFIQFIDRQRWKCNICFRLNELPVDFLQNTKTGRMGDPETRPEILNGTVEYIAPSEYMVRPPQAATYLFVLDVSFQAVETGYLKVATDVLLDCLDQLPGDRRTTIGFVTFDSSVHFYSLDSGSGMPRQLVVTDVDDVFIPTPETLLCNLLECREQIRELLKSLGATQTGGPGNCLGAALQAAYKLLSPIGGRVSVFQCCLPNLGPGALQSRENPNERSAKEVVNLNPATDFYKKLALDCTGQQIGVDIFLLNSQFADLATLAGIAKYSSGQVHYFPKFHVTQAVDQVERFSNEFRHYLTRKIGFESVMRIRCTKGLQLHTFHGNFFVRSTDLLSLPNVNPDAGYALQLSIEESLTDCNQAVFQAAVLYTSAQGERRIRVHTLCTGVSSLLQDILSGADQEAVVGLLAKMAVDRTLSCSVNDARDAMINAAADLCHAFSLTQRSSAGGLLIMRNCKTLPLLILGLLKQRAFRVGVSTKLDDRVYDMERIKNLPLERLLLLIYPALYPLHVMVPQPPRVQLSFEKVDKTGLYLLETVDALYIYVGGRLNPLLLQNVFGVSKFSQLPDSTSALPELDNEESIRIRAFVDSISAKHVVPPPLWILREDSQIRQLFTQYMINDRGESMLSYYEFLQHLRNLLDSY